MTDQKSSDDNKNTPIYYGGGSIVSLARTSEGKLVVKVKYPAQDYTFGLSIELVEGIKMVLDNENKSSCGCEVCLADRYKKLN